MQQYCIVPVYKHGRREIPLLVECQQMVALGLCSNIWTDLKITPNYIGLCD